MPSRMEKYYNRTESANSRSLRNSSLYDNIYNNVQYSNVEGVTTIEKDEQIDIEKIKQMLKNKEENLSPSRPIVKREKLTTSYSEQPELEKNYDIMDVLNKAKDDYVEDNKSRSLKNTQYNILKKINIKDISLEDKDSLKELINTITNTSVLNKLEDKDLSLDLLDNLKSTDNTVVNPYGTNDVFKNQILDNTIDNEDSLDKSFFTSSLNFGEKDFEELNDIKTSLKKNNILISILVFVFLTVVVIGVLFLIFKLK